MELNFDKEIDAILRKARDGESAFSATANPSSHPDADELSAFAENALPEKAKMRAIAHLADCDRCRIILSNLITLRPAEIEIDPAVEKTVVAASLPWYRRLFQFPNLAYSLGALTLVFAGLIGFMALQSFDRGQNSEVSQMSEKPLDTRSAPMQSNTNFAGDTTNSSNSSTSNASVTGNVSPAPVYSANTSAPGASSTANANTAPIKSADERLEPVETKEAQRKDEDEPASRANSFQIDGASGASQKPQAQPKEENKAAATPKNESDDKLSQTEQQPAADSTALSSAAKKSRATTAKTKKTDSADVETTVAGGKTFRRARNVWYDAAYNNQPTTNVTRGTSDYKKLDRDLQLIAENLGGTIVIVWKGKAYRIR